MPSTRPAYLILLDLITGLNDWWGAEGGVCCLTYIFNKLSVKNNQNGVRVFLCLIKYVCSCA